MKTEIKPIGIYFDLNEKGALINPANFSNIPSDLLPVVEQIKESYIQFYQKNLHSLYLRGSLVRGTYQKGISDFDVIGLLYKNEVKWEQAPFEKDLGKKLTKKFEVPLNLELMISSFNDNLFETYPKLAMVLKTQALCIWGTDITQELPDFKPDKSLMIHHQWLKKDIAEFLNKKTPLIADFKAMMKMIIRSGFELVLEREQRFTVDVYPAVQSFIKHYSDKKSEMEQVLVFFLNPDEKPEKQTELVRNFGNWLVLEIEKELL